MMRKLLVLVLAVLASGPLFCQEYTLEGTLNSSVTLMEGGGYSLRLKEVVVFERVTSSADGYVLDPDPYEYRDFTPPERPTGVRATALDASTVRVSYLAATDDIRVIGYRVYRDGQYAGYTPEESYTDTGLSATTTYLYAVQAVDKDRNLSELSDGVYVTTLDTATQESPPHFVSGPSLVYVTDSMAVIGFAADKAVSATVEYGSGTTYGNTVEAESYLTEQLVTIAGLEPSSQYHYRVTINDYSLQGPVASGDDSFYTLGGADLTQPSFVAGPDAFYVSDRIATITFETDEETRGWVLYGIDSVSGNRVDEPYFETEHYVTLYELEPTTEYSYEVTVIDRAANAPVSSGTMTFTTKQQPDTKAPIIFKKPKADYLADRLAIIGWDTDEPSNSVIRFGTTRGIFDRQVVSHSMTRHHQVVLLNLLPHTKYYFVASSTDPSGNTSEDTAENHFTTFMHPDDKAPKIKRVEAVASANGAAIRWETDELAESKVAYGTASGSYAGQKHDGELRTEHEVQLAGLLAGTTYYFQILAKDPSGNEALTQEYIFRTEHEDEGSGHRHDGGGGRDGHDGHEGIDGRGNGRGKE